MIDTTLSVQGHAVQLVAWRMPVRSNFDTWFAVAGVEGRALVAFEVTIFRGQGGARCIHGSCPTAVEKAVEVFFASLAAEQWAA